MGLIRNSIFCLIGLGIGYAFFEDSKSDINCNLFYASEKILARESIPRLLKRNFYKANALPSELAGPGKLVLLLLLFIILEISADEIHQILAGLIKKNYAL